MLLGILPSATGPLLGTAAQLGYEPVWMGNTPAWIDGFFDPEVLPPSVFDSFYMVHGNTYWGEDRPGFEAFLRAFDKGYMLAVAGLEIFSRALESGDLTDTGVLAAVRSIQGWDMGGLSQPIDLSSMPYEGHRQIRVLRPQMDVGGWEVVSDFAPPESDGS